MACRNPAYQEFCAQTHKYIPCCEEIDKSGFSCVSFPGDHSGELKFMLQFFELREIFLQKKMIKFTAQGICMYPCVRPGDILYIEPKRAAQIKIGDIAVFRRFSQFFGHRTIGKGIKDGFEYIITSPDTTQYGNEGPCFDRDILGVVSHIERRGKLLETAKQEVHSLKKISFGVLLKCYYIRQYLFFKLIGVLDYLQKFKAYRMVARFLFARAKEKMNRSLYVPLNIRTSGRFVKKVSVQELVDSNLKRDKNSIFEWRVAFVVNFREAASLLFIYRPGTCPFSGWWLGESRIMVRYRGTAIEEELRREVNELLGLFRINRISVSVFRGEYLGSLFLKRIGFKKISAYKESALSDKKNLSVSRIIMERNVCESSA